MKFVTLFVSFWMFTIAWSNLQAIVDQQTTKYTALSVMFGIVLGILNFSAFILFCVGGL